MFPAIFKPRFQKPAVGFLGSALPATSATPGQAEGTARDKQSATSRANPPRASFPRPLLLGFSLGTEGLDPCAPQALNVDPDFPRSGGAQSGPPGFPRVVFGHAGGSRSRTRLPAARPTLVHAQKLYVDPPSQIDVNSRCVFVGDTREPYITADAVLEKDPSSLCIKRTVVRRVSLETSPLNARFVEDGPTSFARIFDFMEVATEEILCQHENGSILFVSKGVYLGSGELTPVLLPSTVTRNGMSHPISYPIDFFSPEHHFNAMLDVLPAYRTCKKTGTYQIGLGLFAGGGYALTTIDRSKSMFQSARAPAMPPYPVVYGVGTSGSVMYNHTNRRLHGDKRGKRSSVSSVPKGTLIPYGNGELIRKRAYQGDGEYAVSFEMNGEEWVVDTWRHRSWGSFVNDARGSGHEPNAEIVVLSGHIVFIHTLDVVYEGEEILVDYGPSYNAEDLFEPKRNPGAVRIPRARVLGQEAREPGASHARSMLPKNQEPQGRDDDFAAARAASPSLGDRSFAEDLSRFPSPRGAPPASASSSMELAAPGAGTSFGHAALQPGSTFPELGPDHILSLARQARRGPAQDPPTSNEALHGASAASAAAAAAALHPDAWASSLDPSWSPGVPDDVFQVDLAPPPPLLQPPCSPATDFVLDPPPRPEPVPGDATGAPLEALDSSSCSRKGVKRRAEPALPSTPALELSRPWETVCAQLELEPVVLPEELLPMVPSSVVDAWRALHEAKGEASKCEAHKADLDEKLARAMEALTVAHGALDKAVAEVKRPDTYDATDAVHHACTLANQYATAVAKLRKLGPSARGDVGGARSSVEGNDAGPVPQQRRDAPSPVSPQAKVPSPPEVES